MVQLFANRNETMTNPDCPVLWAWKVETPSCPAHDLRPQPVLEGGHGRRRLPYFSGLWWTWLGTTSDHDETIAGSLTTVPAHGLRQLLVAQGERRQRVGVGTGLAASPRYVNQSWSTGRSARSSPRRIPACPVLWHQPGEMNTCSGSLARQRWAATRSLLRGYGTGHQATGQGQRAPGQHRAGPARSEASGSARMGASQLILGATPANGRAVIDIFSQVASYWQARHRRPIRGQRILVKRACNSP